MAVGCTCGHHQIPLWLQLAPRVLSWQLVQLDTPWSVQLTWKIQQILILQRWVLLVLQNVWLWKERTLDWLFHLFVCTLALWQRKICILDQPLHIWYTIQYVYIWAILVVCGLKHKKWSSPGLCSSAKENGVYPCSCWGTGWLLHLASVGSGFLYLLRYFINK